MLTTEAIDWECALPRVKNGLGVPYLTYGSGRVGVSVTRWGGLHQIAYYGIAPESAAPIFFEADAASSYARLFRFQIQIDDRPYNLELHDTCHFPFGYSSFFSVPELGVDVCHRLTLLNDAVLFSLNVLQNRNYLPIRLHFEHHGNTRKSSRGNVVRTWSEWSANEDLNALTTFARDRWKDDAWQAEIKQLETIPGQVGLPLATVGIQEGETSIALFGDGKLLIDERVDRYNLYSDSFTEGCHAAALLFASNRQNLADRIATLRPSLTKLGREKEERHEERTGDMPRLCTSSPLLNSYFTNAPGISETLMVEDKPGAMRAASMHYWVWGWDTVMCSEAYLVSGHSKFVRDALRFYRDTADARRGIAHQFSRDLHLRIPQAPSAQCLYIIMLYGYLAYVDDSSFVREVYPFARKVFDTACETVNAIGLGTGPALWPDFPVYAGHTGNDCSVFNNSILYQAARAMEVLAHHATDTKTAERARLVSRNLEEKFIPTFWDEEKRYFVDSVDSVTLEHRKCYPSHAILWQTPFSYDLASENLQDCATFIRDNHATPRGFLPYPRWDSAFNGDRNQLGQTWPITDVFDTMCMAYAGEQRVLTEWIDEIEWFWRQLTVPEAYSVQTVNDSGTPDAPGGKQPFSAKSWYMAIIQSLAGVAIDLGGITLGPGLERKIGITGYHYRGKTLKFSCEGSGQFPDMLTVNGVPVYGTCKVPRSLLSRDGETTIVYKRTANLPAHPVILTLHGASIERYPESTKDYLRCDLTGSSDVWMHFASPSQPKIIVDGQNVRCHYDASSKRGKALLPLRAGKATMLEISIATSISPLANKQAALVR